MADDWDAGGVVRTICAGWESSPAGSFVHLRLLAAIHRLVLTGRAPELAEFYPNLGGSTDPSGAWLVFEPVLAQHVEELREALHVPPQTNEVGRSAALLVGLFHAVRRTGLSNVRLLEPGSSAGLNLLVDEFYFAGAAPENWTFGPEDSPLRIRDAVFGSVQPIDFSIVERRGCDLSPVDASSVEGQLRLISFVWPHQLDRHQRLRAALEIVAKQPVQVDRASASEWLASQLSQPVDSDVLTVVWHSVTRLYWPPEETSRVDELISTAGRRIPIAHIAMEHPSVESAQPAELTVDLHLPASGIEPSRIGIVERQGGPVRLATVADHGIPVRKL